MHKNDVDILWEKTLLNVEAKLSNSRAFDNWIRPIKLLDFSNNVLLIEIPNMTFAKGFFVYIDTLKEEFFEVSSIRPEIKISYKSNNSPVIEPQNQKHGKTEVFSLNPGYTFDNFVVANSNRLAHASATAVAQSPGIAYNPLFLYGGFGLGKTHLIQAIGQFVRKREEDNVKIMYIPAEIFVNEFIQSIQNKTTSDFRSKFRSIDFLILDDIHFIAGKGGTQEEFFHTFNFLYNQRKQIVLSSDRPPKEISFLEKRLISRFEWGLVVDIQPPDFETRVAILKQKCDMRKIYINDDIIYYISEKIVDNVRVLEGFLNRIFAYSTLLNKEINISMIDSMIEGLNESTKKIVTLDLILEKVCDYFKIKEEEILGKKRLKNIVIPRQIAMFLGRELTNDSLNSIAQKFGGKDHTTVMYACKKVKKMLEEDNYIKGIVTNIKKNI